MEKLIKYFKPVHWPLWVIFVFCVIGLFRNFYQMGMLVYGADATAYRILWAMIVIYFAQAALILARESKAWLLSAIQAFFCFYVYEDFTFLPIATFVRNVAWYIAPNMDYGWARFWGMTMISALFSLEILKTYLIFALTEEAPSRKTKKRVARKKPAAAPGPAI